MDHHTWVGIGIAPETNQEARQRYADQKPRVVSLNSNCTISCHPGSLPSFRSGVCTARMNTHRPNQIQLTFLPPAPMTTASLDAVPTCDPPVCYFSSPRQPTCFVKPLMLDRRSCQAAVSKVLDWDFSTIYPTHGACPIYDGKNAIATAFDFLWD